MSYKNTAEMRPLLITFCGLPGSGKTTTAKHLEKETGAVRLTTDEWMADLGIDFFDAVREKLQERLYRHSLKLLELGQSVILEDGLWSRAERDTHREVARKLGATIEIHYFDLSFDELWRRLEGRNALRAHGAVPITKEQLTQYWSMFERPDIAELRLFDRYIVHN